MRRTQIYLTERQIDDLKRLAVAREISASTLIREAVDEKLRAAQEDTARWRQRLRGARGAWAGREDVEVEMKRVRGQIERRFQAQKRRADR